MPHQHGKCGFSVPVVFRSKTLCAGNGRSLAKHSNAAEEHHRDALRVCLSRPTDYVTPLVNGATITCESRLAVNLDKQTELAITMLMGH